MNTKKTLLLAVTLLVMMGLATSVLPAHANTPPPWTVSLDANSLSNIDTNVATTATQTKTFFIGAVINASGGVAPAAATCPKPPSAPNPTCLQNVFGWQFSIVYDNTSFVPQGDPVTGAANDAAGPTVNFGAQPLPTSPNWAARLINPATAFGSSTILPVDATHQKIQVFYTLLAPPPPAVPVGVDIFPQITATHIVSGNLLAQVAFELKKAVPSPGASFSITDIKFVDPGAATIAGINGGPPITEIISNTPPTASFTATNLPTGDPSCSAVTGLACSAFAVRFDGSASSATAPNTIATPAGYFWDFGDGSQDNANVGALCLLLTCNQGTVAIHDYGIGNKFNASLRVVDTPAGVTGSARDALGGLIINTQPSHTFRAVSTISLVDNPPVVSFTESATTVPIGTPITLTITATDTDATPVASIKVVWGDGLIDTLPATATTDTHSYAVAGTFVVYVNATDTAALTTKSATATKTITAPLVVTVSCPASGLTVGKAFNCTVSATGGTPPYTGTGTFSRTETTKGAHTETFTVTDSAARTASGSAAVSIAGQPLVVTASCPTTGLTVGKPFNCTVSATGGTGPYTGTGTISRTETTKGAKTESFTVTDANTVSAVGTASVTIGGQPLVVTATCPTTGLTVGKAFNCTVSATGGTGPYTGTGTISRTEITKGAKTESFTVTDANTVSAIGTASVTIAGQPLVVTATCPTTGITVGKAFNCTVSVTGGTGPYTGTGTISRTETTKGSKTESFTVTDANTVSAIGTASVTVGGQPLVVTATCPTTGLTVGKAFNCTVSATGGTGPYTGTGTISRTETTKGAKTESFTVTDANTVSAIGTASVTIAGQPLVVTATCPTTGLTTGKPFNCTVSATGGSAPYTGTGTVSRTEATKGAKTESFTVTDANTVSAIGTASVTIGGQPLVVSVSCPTTGLTAGKAFNCTVSATGGSTPYTGTGTLSRTEATKGAKTESFTVTDANTVSAIGTASVTIAAQPLVVTASCPTTGLTAGKAFNCTVSATGGSAPYTGTGTISRTEATKGAKTESFTVTDANTISAIGTASVTIAAQPLVVTASCPTTGLTAGKAFNCTVSATGGTAPYTGTGTISRTETTKGAKTESFTVTDANTVSAIGTASVSIAAQPLVVTATCPTTGLTAGKAFNCTVSATGGTAPYTGTGTISRTEVTKGAKTESFTVTDANTVSAIGTASVSIAAQPLTATFAVSANPTANSPVTFTATVSGGTTSYSFSWNFGDGTAAGTTNPVTHTYTTKGAKNVVLTVTDANAVFINVPQTVSVTGTPLVVTATCPTSGITVGKAFNCTVSASGDTGPYTGTGSISRTETTKGSKTETFSVTDANAVTRTATATVTVAGQPLVVTATCPTSGVTLGKAFNCTVSATGGTGPYTGTGTISRTETTKGVKTESFTVTDANTVSAIGTASVTVAGQPLVVTATCPTTGLTAGKAFNCTVSATGGTGPYTGTGTISRTETTKGAKTESFTVTDANTVSAIGTASVSIAGQPLVVTASCPTTGLTAGKAFNCTVSATGGTGPYTGTGTISRTETTKGAKTESFTVTDANTVSAIGTASVTIAAQPIVVTATCPTTGLTLGKAFNCTVSATGGTGPYTGTGTISRTETTKGAKTESFTVTDANTVSAVGTASVTIAGQPLVVTATCPTTGLTAGKAFNCTVSATGGTAPYTGTGTISRTEATKGAKTESFTVTDGNAVSAIGTASVTIAAQPLVVTATCPTTGLTVGKAFNCTVSATGGSAPYTGTGTISRTETTKGSHTESFTVTDANTVSASGTASVTVGGQPLVVTATCPTTGLTAGKAFNCTVSATGGTAPYTGTGTISRTEVTKGAKTESFTVTDGNAVSAIGTASVTIAAQPLTATFTVSTNPTAGSPVTLTATVSGGSSPYTFSWNFGDGTAAGTTNPVSHTYTTKGAKNVVLTVTDANAVFINVPQTVSVTGTPLVVTATCPTSGITAGKAFNCTVSASGDTGPYTGTGTISRTETTKGSKTETFSVTDANGVIRTASATVTVAAQPLVVTATCPTTGLTAGKAFNCTVSATGGTAPYTGTGTISRTEATKGAKTESFTVTDGNAVSAIGTASATIAAQPLVVSVSCPTNATAGVAFNCTVSATGGTAPYTGTGTFSRTETTKGSKTETFSVTDTNLVSASGSATVAVAGTPLVVTVTCPTTGVTVGKAFNCTVSASGDTAPYTGTGTLSRTETTKGAHTESFTVTSANGVTQSGSASVTVGGQPLVVTATCPTTGLTLGKAFNCTVSATGGTGPYTGTGTISRTETTKGAKTESFTVTDANTVSAIGTASVTIAGQPLVVTATCPTSGITLGKAFNCTVSATGGTAPYTGTGTISRTETTKGAKTESFTVTDANTVSSIGTASVTVAGQPLVVTATCPTTGLTAGKAFNCTVSATGGTGPYTGTGTISRTETTKGAKTESFTVTDANTVSAIGRASVTIAAQPLVVTASCPTTGLTAGKAFNCTVSATGGTAPYTGTGTISRTEATKGAKTESFTVTDGNAVSAIGTSSVTVAAQPLVVTVVCPSTATAGTAFQCTVSATGGSTPYTGTGTFSRTETTKGLKTETFSVTDANTVAASGSATVAVSGSPLVVTVSCPSSGVTAGKAFNCTVSATGDTAPYTGTGTFSRTEATKGSKTESFTVTSANGVSASSSATVSVAAQPLVVTVSCPAPTGGITAGKAFSCTVSATGGSTPYTGTGTFSRTEATKGSKTESFTVVDSNTASASGSATVSVAAQPLVVTASCPTTGLTAGKAFNCTVSATGGSAPYTGTGTISRTETTKGAHTESFTVTDGNAVSAIGTASVTIAGQPLVVTATCPTTGLTLGKPFNCTVSATGGTAPYTGTGTISRTETTKGVKTESFTVTDANTVSAIGTASVTIAGQPLVVTATCPTAGLTAGKAFNCTVSATGGTGPYTGTGTISRTEPTKGAKTETFTVTDANTVSAGASATVTIAPQPLVVTVACPSTALAGTAFQCTVSANGGTAPYTGTGTFTKTETTKGSKTESFTVTDANTASASGSATVAVSGTPLVVTVTCPTSGTVGKAFNCTVSASGDTAPYTGTGTFSRTETSKGSKTETFSVTDANAVTQSGSVIVIVTGQPLVVTVSCPAPTGGITAGKPFSCTVSATGGTGPYTGTGSFSRTEATKGSKTESFTVTDANTVSASGSATVTVAAQPLVVTVSCPTTATAGTAFNCTVSASGGTAPYTGTGTFSRTETTKGMKTESFTVTDANTVSASGSATVAVSGTPLVVTVTCPTSGITVGKPFMCAVSASGDTAPYTGTGTFSVTEQSKGAKVVSFSVTDANSVTASGSANVNVAGQPLAVSVSCPSSGITAGKAFSCTVSATGGTAPYTGTSTFSVTQPAKGTFTESFTVRDANSASASGSASVTVAAQPLVVTVTCGIPSTPITAGKPFNCTVSATGGTAPYTGTGTFSVTQPTKGTFTESFSVRDSNAVTASGSASVTVTAQPLVVNVSCPSTGVTTGKPFMCTVAASGGTSPYTGAGTFSLTETVKGVHVESFTVKDANGVSASGTANVVVNGQPLVVTVTCPPTATAGVAFTCMVSASGGTPPYAGIGTFTVTEPVKGTHTEMFRVQDGNGVLVIGSATVMVSPQPLVATFTITGTLQQFKPVTFTASASGGTTPYAFSWNFGDSSPLGTTNPVTHAYATSGIFTVTVTVTDGNAVTASSSQTITIAPATITASFTESTSSALTGVAINFDASGSTSSGTIISYSWSFGDTMSGSGVTVSHSYANTGNAMSATFTVTLTVKDNNGQTASASATKTITDRPPVAAFTFSPTNPTPGQTVAFDASSSADPDGTITNYTWSFGDLVSGSGKTTTHAYAGTGAFTVTLTVTDNSGNTGSSSATVTVVPSVQGHASLSGYQAKPDNIEPDLSVKATVTLFARATNDGTVPVTVYVDFHITSDRGVIMNLFTQVVSLTPGQVIDGTLDPRFAVTFAPTGSNGGSAYSVTATLYYSSAQSNTIGDPSFVASVPSKTFTFEVQDNSGNQH